MYHDSYCYCTFLVPENSWAHDDIIKWKLFPRYWPFVRGIQRSLGNSPHKGQWCGALMSSLICARIYGWANNGDVGDSRRHLAHYDIIVMPQPHFSSSTCYMILVASLMGHMALLLTTGRMQQYFNVFTDSTKHFSCFFVVFCWK